MWKVSRSADKADIDFAPIYCSLALASYTQAQGPLDHLGCSCPIVHLQLHGQGSNNILSDTNRDCDNMVVQALSAEYYTPFLSDVAKQRKPAPSQCAEESNFVKPT